MLIESKVRGGAARTCSCLTRLLRRARPNLQDGQRSGAELLIRHNCAVGLADRLSRRGSVERQAFPTDRRRVPLRLAARGARKRSPAFRIAHARGLFIGNICQKSAALSLKKGTCEAEVLQAGRPGSPSVQTDDFSNGKAHVDQPLAWGQSLRFPRIGAARRPAPT